jgi:hypothetical protein
VFLVFPGAPTLFATDASGIVTVSNFFGTDPTSFNVDNFGSVTGDIFFGQGEFCDTQNDCFDEAASGGFFSPTQWIVSAVTSVPEPTTIALFGAGLAVFGWSRRRRDAKVART